MFNQMVEIDIPQSMFEEQGRQLYGAKLLEIQVSIYKLSICVCMLSLHVYFCMHLWACVATPALIYRFTIAGKCKAHWRPTRLSVKSEGCECISGAPEREHNLLDQAESGSGRYF